MTEFLPKYAFPICDGCTKREHQEIQIERIGAKDLSNLLGCGCIYEEFCGPAYQAGLSEDERTCRYVPNDLNVVYDDDDNEIVTSEADYNNGDYHCDKCYEPMLGGELGWFNEKPGKHGGWEYTPRFNFCPYCGRKVIK